MDFMEFIVISIPLALMTGYILKAIFIRIMPPLDEILDWPYRSAEFEYGTEVFNTILDKLLKYNRYTIRKRTQNSVYLVESPLKWKRTGFCFYVVYDEKEKNIRIYFKSIFYDNTQNAEVVEEMLTYLQYHGSVKIL
jgi:hypothetical protein